MRSNLWQHTARTLLRALILTVAMGATALPALAQNRHSSSGDALDPVLHINTRWKECSFQISPTLTQKAWRQFTGEAAVVTYFRPLVDATPMGRGSFELSAVQWQTGIDDHESAWNDTMVHPDSTHWLFEGSGLKFPGLTGRVGVTDKTDIGFYFTKNPNANYGFYGVQVQQSLVNDVAKSGWAAAARVSLVSIFGPDDLDFSVYGVDLVASRKYALFSKHASISPYATVSGSLSRAHEKTPVVNLKDENVFGAQASAGAIIEVFGARVSMEYVAARVPNVSMKIGFGVSR